MPLSSSRKRRRQRPMSLLEIVRVAATLLLIHLVEVSCGTATTTGATPGRPVVHHDESSDNDDHPLQIYWINSADAKERRKLMEQNFEELKPIANVEPIRVSATMREDVIRFEKEGRLRLDGIELVPGIPNWLLHQQNKYTHVEVACVMSHIRAIKQAYESGQNLALIIEDDMVLEPAFINGWKAYADLAPRDWQVLQFFTNNKLVGAQGLKLTDPWVAWQSQHFGTSAYIVNRDGMTRILEQTYWTSHSKNDVVLNIKEPEILVADEILFYLTKSYTTTYPWVIQRDVASSIQAEAAMSSLETKQMMSGRAAAPPHVVPRKEKILVFLNLRLTSKAAIDSEFKRLMADFEALALWNHESKWIVRAVVADSRLRPYLDSAIAMVGTTDRIDIEPDTKGKEDFNDFQIVSHFISVMDQYDFILLKDSNQRIGGFPWNSFMDRAQDAVISGPLRENPSKSLSRNVLPKDHNVHFRVTDAKVWKDDLGPNELFKAVQPITVPFVPTQFVLLNGKFAKWFFNQALIKPFNQQPDKSGPELMWCAAAKEYMPEKKHCTVIPLVTQREILYEQRDKKSILISNDSRLILKEYSDKFAEWMMFSKQFIRLLGRDNPYELWRLCDELAGYLETHDLTACYEQLMNQPALYTSWGWK